jgi:hypothetical protein
MDKKKKKKKKKKTHHIVLGLGGGKHHIQRTGFVKLINPTSLVLRIVVDEKARKKIVVLLNRFFMINHIQSIV